MTTKIAGLVAGALFAAGMAMTGSAQAQAYDEEAAKALFKRNDCGKCHHPSRDKKGPSLQKMAKDLNKKPAEAMNRIVKNATTAPKVKLLDDGKEEEHKIIDTKDEKQIRNMGTWLLKQ